MDTEQNVMTKSRGKEIEDKDTEQNLMTRKGYYTVKEDNMRTVKK